MKRMKLVAARAHMSWTLEEASEHIGCAPNTLSRWELGIMSPSSYSRARLCEAYKKTVEELGLEEDVIAPSTDLSEVPDNVQAILNADLTLRLTALVFTSHCNRRKLQNALVKTIEESLMDTGQEAALTRREALQRLALLPVIFTASGSIQRPIEDTLNQCAAGITACEYLTMGNHEDLSLSFSLLSTYLPILKTIVRDSSLYRKEAAGLVTQCYLLMHVLGLHLESPDVAIAKGYANFAVTFSKESRDLALQLRALRNLAWAYNHVKQFRHALKAITQAKSLVEQNRTPSPPQVRSGTYTTLAVIQVKNGLSATSTLQQAQEAFFAPTVANDDLIHVDFGYPQLMRDNGLAHHYKGEYEDALQAFAHIIDPEELTSKVPLPVRIRVEVLNAQARSALKSSNRDMEQVITFWRASMQGAIDLKSQQHFDEACMTYEIMEGVWPDETRITEMRDLIVHW